MTHAFTSEGASPRSSRSPRNQTRRAYELVRSLIRSGDLTDAEPLVEDDLVRMLDLPRTSVREALVLLATEGLVSRQRHVGTRVSGVYYQIPVDDILPNAPSPGFMVRTIDDRHVRSSPTIRQGLGTEAPVVGMIEHIFEHVSSEGSQPLGVRTAYYRTTYDQPRSWASCPPLAVGFERAFGVALGTVETVVDAVASDAETARLLHLEPGSAVLMREQRLHDVNGVVQEYTFSHYRADRVSFPLKHTTVVATARP